MPVSRPSKIKNGRKFTVESRRFLRANVSALVATGVEWCLVTAMVAGGMHYLVATAVGATVGAVTDFAIKRNWAFIRGRVGSIQLEAGRYVIACVLSLSLNVVLAYGLVDKLHMPKIPGVITASIIVGLLWNYPVHRYFVFPSRGNKTPATTLS